MRDRSVGALWWGAALATWAAAFLALTGRPRGALGSGDWEIRLHGWPREWLVLDTTLEPGRTRISGVSVVPESLPLVLATWLAALAGALALAAVGRALSRRALG